MKHLYFLLTVILLMTCTVKAQSQSDYKEFENCVLVDGLGYSLNETTKEASVVPTMQQTRMETNCPKGIRAMSSCLSQ